MTLAFDSESGVLLHVFAVFALLFRQEQELRDDPEAKDGRGHCRHPC